MYNKIFFFIGIGTYIVLCSVAQSRLTLCDSMDCSPPGSSVYGILQARILEWVAIAFARGIFPTEGANPGLSHCRWFFTVSAMKEAFKVDWIFDLPIPFS